MHNTPPPPFPSSSGDAAPPAPQPAATTTAPPAAADSHLALSILRLAPAISSTSTLTIVSVAGLVGTYSLRLHALNAIITDGIVKRYAIKEVPPIFKKPNVGC